MSHGPGFVDESPRADRGAVTARPADIASSEPHLPPGPLLLDLLDQPAVHRIDPEWDPLLLPVARIRVSSFRWFAAGLASLLGCGLVFSLVDVVEAQFQYSRLTGALATFFLLICVSLLVRGAWSEWRSYRDLQCVDQLRAALLRDDVQLAELRELCRPWLFLAQRRFTGADVTDEMIKGCSTVAEVRAILQTQVLRNMQRVAQKAGRRAALRGCALIALVPSPVLEALIVAWQSLALLGQIADIYGLRPGVIVTFALVRRVALTAAGVAGADLFSQAVADQVLQRMPGVKHLAASVPGMSLAAVRISRLADFAAEACSPLPTRRS